MYHSQATHSTQSRLADSSERSRSFVEPLVRRLAAFVRDAASA